MSGHYGYTMALRNISPFLAISTFLTDSKNVLFSQLCSVLRFALKTSSMLQSVCKITFTGVPSQIISIVVGTVPVLMTDFKTRCETWNEFFGNKGVYVDTETFPVLP